MSSLRGFARSLLRRRAVPIAVVAILSLGIGVSTAIFSVVNALMLRPLPYDDPAQLVQVWSALPAIGATEGRVSYPRFDVYRSQTTAFVGLGAYAEQDLNLTGGSSPVRIAGARATASLFHLLGVAPVRGRLFTAEEDRAGGANVAVISERLWHTRFGSNPDIVGRSVSMDGVPVTIVGVLPASLAVPTPQTDVWLPRVWEPAGIPEAQVRMGAGYLGVLGRLRPGATVAQANADLRSISDRYRAEFGSLRDMGYEPHLVPLAEQLRGDAGRTLNILWAAATLVFLIACANAGNLLLARHSGRRDELALREAVGATRAQLVRMLVAESLILASVATAIGLALGVAVVRAAAPLTAAAVPGFAPVSLDPVIFAYAAGALVVTVLLAGVIPAWAATSQRAVAPPGVVRRAATPTRAAAHGRRIFAAAQVAVSFVLLMTAVQLLTVLRDLQRTDMGFEPRDALMMQVAPAQAKYGTLQEQQAYYEALLGRLAAVPGVTAAGGIHILPTLRDDRIMFAIEGQPAPKPEERPLAQFSIATPGAFRAMGISLHEGRLPAESDRPGTTPVIVINQTLARRFFQGVSPIGQRIQVGSIPGQREIIGVVSDVRNQGPAMEALPGLYMPVGQFFARLPPMFLVVRTERPPASIAAEVRQAAAAVDPDQPLARVQTMESALRAALAVPRLRTLLVAAFAVLGSLIALAGVYSVMAYVVAEREREFDIRLALGAPPRAVAALVVKGTLGMAVAGLVAGAAGAVAAGGLLRRLLPEAGAGEPLVFAGVAVMLLAATLVAALPPSARAVRLRPARLLRG